MKRLLALLALMLCMAAPARAAGDLYVYSWSEYLPDEVVREFTAETGIKVHISTYDSNEAMYAKLKLAGEGYDLAVPSSYFVEKMAREGMLRPLDKTRLPNLKNLLPRFTKLEADPGNAYCVPYLWGSTALAVNTDLIPAEKLKSYNGLWDTALKGRLLLPNDPREVVGLALKAAGHSFNDTDPAHLAAAAARLKELIPSVRAFDSESPKQAILSGEVAAGVVWNGEAFIANAENPAVAYVYPEEGYSLWVDCFAVPVGAKHLDEAHAFMDYLLRPEVSARISTELGYSTPNAAAIPLLPPEVRDNPIVYPPDEVLARGEFLRDIGEGAKAMDDIWVTLK